MKVAVDTQVPLRAEMRDHAAQADMAAQVASEAELVAVALPCLCEWVWAEQQEAAEGATTVITLHGRPCAALVPPANLQRTPDKPGGLLRLRGTGACLWGARAARAADALGREWD